ncbi:beta-lactamase family protein [Kordiimonas sp. SCSIO 12603]|uniref:serine hydrolase domain-containing protein n=1 Tax=Kordiimonas sp. SCSIO 12603 TaxID=2829596 RepID=UPI00210382EE|nr:serine hydrolase [Kordiimonas sp. SCSIO 12603]UTW59543.1 beta-lactamase family protein [Kordiimonas sp. SCSIO 12603]
MRPYVYTMLIAIFLGLLWAFLTFTSIDRGWFHTAIAPKGDIQSFSTAAQNEIATRSQGNAVLLLIADGEIYSGYTHSTKQAINQQTLFQVASLSKWVTAWGVLSLVEQGKLDLDTPVDTYLSRWHLPPSQFDNTKVTIRRLLSHTAGLTDGLGYGGFLPEQDIQSLEQSLTQAEDASPGKDGRVMVGIEPGSAFAYSGGGYTLLQLLIEEVSGQSFNDYMQQHIFQPLGMMRSTYILDTHHENVATLYDTQGKPATHYKFTALAASSLYTSGHDMTLFIQAHFPTNDLAAGRGVLSPEMLTRMREPHASELGADIWGLGTILYASNNKGDFIAGHDGSNEPAINTSVRYNPATGDGIVILETGNKFLATELAGEWVYWQTSNIDLMLFSMKSEQMINIILLGWLVLILAAIARFVRLYKAGSPRK